MVLLQQFSLPDFQFLANEVLCALYRVYQHVADGEELRLLVADDTAVGRDVDFAVGESIEGIECLVRRHTRGQVYQDFHFRTGQVVHALCLDFPFLNGLGDALAECGYGL